MLEYVKPELRLAYLERVLKPREINYFKIIYNYSIKLKIDFYEQHWRILPFEAIIETMFKRFEADEINSFILKLIPQNIIVDHIYLFFENDKYIKAISNLKLDNIINVQKLFDEYYCNTIGIRIARLVKNKNIDKMRASIIMLKNISRNEQIVIEYFEYLKDVKLIESLLKRNDLESVHENRVMLEKLYIKIGGKDLDLIKNITLKGTLWIKLKWLGLKNIVQKR